MRFDIDFGMGGGPTSADLKLVLIGLLAMLDAIEKDEAKVAGSGQRMEARLNERVAEARRRVDPTTSTNPSP